MNESEVKEAVEKIARLEQHTRIFRHNDAWYAVNLACAKVDRLEQELEMAGFLLGDSGHDIIIYRASWLKTAESVYLIFDTANWCWRPPESEAAR